MERILKWLKRFCKYVVHEALVNGLRTDLTKEESVEIPWQQGDVMIVDNMLAMHARNSFVPPRRILAVMVHN